MEGGELRWLVSGRLVCAWLMTKLEIKNGLALMNAAESGDLKAIGELLECGANPSLVVRHPNWGKTTALIVAVESKQFTIAHRLVEKGADVQFLPPEGGANAATRAVRSWWARLDNESERAALERLIALLLAKGAKPSPGCLASASAFGDLKMLRTLLMAGVGNDFSKPSDDEPPVRGMDEALAAAVNYQQGEAFAELLMAGAGPNARIHFKGPCIHVAVVNSNKPMVEALIAAKADLNQQATVAIGGCREGRVLSGEKYGNLIVHTPATARNATPLIIAVRCENQEMLRLLVEGGADLNATDGDGLTALAWAVRVKFKEAEDYLRSNGASESGMEGSPLYRLYHAAAFGDVDKVLKALDEGASVNGIVVRRGFSFTPLIRAARAGRDAVISILLQAGADPNLAGHESVLLFSTSPLITAAKCGHLQAVKLLLAAGADPEATVQTPFQRGKGRNALQHALDGGHAEIAALLRAAAKPKTIGRRTKP